MFKLVVLFCLVAIAVAKPSGLEQIHVAQDIPVLKTALISEPAHFAVHEPILARVGEHIESVPTAVSHQSSTVVHSKANLVTPLVAPVVKTHLAPAIKTYAASYLDSQPIIKTYAAAPSYYKSYLSPAAYAYSAGAPTYSAGPLTYSAGSPLLLPQGYSYGTYGYGLPSYRTW